jgi:hypothetical protein
MKGNVKALCRCILFVSRDDLLQLYCGHIGIFLGNLGI